MNFEEILKDKLKTQLLRRYSKEDSSNINLEKLFNQRINCGGYALKVDACIFSKNGSFEKAVSSILDTFPFARLLGDSNLQDDEYLVLYRKEKNKGHHFIRIEDDGTVTEKSEANSPQKFNNWGNLSDSPEAVFAVKKEHNIDFPEGTIMIPLENSMDFEESVINAIENKQNSFSYHNHNYNFKKSDDGFIYIFSNSTLIAKMLLDDKSFDIEIEPDKKDFVSNTKPSTPIVIKNGILQKDTEELEL